MKPVLIAAMTLAAGVTALSASGARAAEPIPGEAALRAANAQEVRGLLATDAKALGDLWADTLVVTNPFNQLVNRAQVLNLVASGVLAFSGYDRRIEYVHAYGDLAVVAGAEDVVWAGKVPLAGKTSHLRFTALWRRRGAGWVEVARHANIIPER
jgi:hypothetical protein